jgi:predicted transcriptional regulator
MKLINKQIQRSGLKKIAIARLLGIHPKYLSMLLNGKRKPKNLPKIKQRIRNIINRT